MYLKQSDHSLGTTNKFIIGTPIMDVGNATVCLSFSYHMMGYDVNRLSVWNQRLDLSLVYIWHQRYGHNDTWWQIMVTVAKLQGRILFQVDGGSGSLADVAIDDVLIAKGSCHLDTGHTRQPLPWVCDFEDDFCNLVHDYYGDDDEWRWQFGTSRSRDNMEDTGPVADVNSSSVYSTYTSNKLIYMFVD